MPVMKENEHFNSLQGLYWSWILLFLVQDLLSGCCSYDWYMPALFVPGCSRDWYMLSHPAQLCSRLQPGGPPECGTFVAPERHARSRTRQSYFQVLYGSTGATPAGACERPRPLASCSTCDGQWSCNVM
jgi:hypothetical protein